MWKLDFGCGNGGYPGGDGVHPRGRGSWLQREGDDRTIAIDIDPSAVEEARRRVKNGAIFLIADGRRMPFADASFDYVREWGVLHHIPHYEQPIKEIARVLKTGGTFVACETIDNDPLYSICRTIVGNWKGASIESRFKSNTFLAELEKYFEIDQVEYWYRPLIVDIPSYFFESYPGWVAGLYWQYYGSKFYQKLRLLPRFARHVTITATKRLQYENVPAT
ncbi:MAG: class I SAM-dependent methyltransferase [Dehalococcoidia bacterium]